MSDRITGTVITATLTVTINNISNYGDVGRPAM